MKKAIKMASIYIGAIIGAGFASGREIVIFFGSTSFFSLIFAAIFLTVVYILFLNAKKEDNILFNVLKLVSMSISVILMMTSFRSIEGILNISNFSTYIVIACIFLGILNIEKLKYLNFAAIILIVLLLIFISKKDILTRGGFNIFNGLTYTGMNTLLGGLIILEDKTSLNKKEKIYSSIFVFFIFLILFYFLHPVAAQYKDSPLPIVSHCLNKGYEIAPIIIISLAIITTLLSSIHIVYKCIRKHLNDYFAFIYLFLLFILSYNITYFDFSQIMYPILGYMGCIYIAYILVKKVFSFNDSTNKINTKIHYRRHNK